MIYDLYRFCGVESISQMISKYQRQTGQIFCDASLVSILPEGVITIPLLDVWEELDFTKEQNKKQLVYQIILVTREEVREGIRRQKGTDRKRNGHTHSNEVLEVLWSRLRQCPHYKNSCIKRFSNKLTETAVYSMAAIGHDEMIMKPLKSAFF